MKILNRLVLHQLNECKKYAIDSKNKYFKEQSY